MGTCIEEGTQWYLVTYLAFTKFGDNVTKYGD